MFYVVKICATEKIQQAIYKPLYQCFKFFGLHISLFAKDLLKISF